jgi:hypothetical protein
VKTSLLGACLFPYRWNALQAERVPGNTVAEPWVGALLRAGLPNAVGKFRQRHLKLSHRIAALVAVTELSERSATTSCASSAKRFVGAGLVARRSFSQYHSLVEVLNDYAT